MNDTTATATATRTAHRIAWNEFRMAESEHRATLASDKPAVYVTRSARRLALARAALRQSVAQQRRMIDRAWKA